MLKNILGNSVVTALIRGSSFGGRIISLLIVAYYSEPAYFGRIALFFTVAEVARLVADFGVDTYTMREYASHRSKQTLEETVSSAICAKIIFGLVVASISLGFMRCMWSNDLLLILPFALMVISPLIMNLPINFFIAKMRGRYIVLFISFSGLMLLVVFYLVFVFIRSAQIAFFIIPIFEAAIGLILICKVPLLKRSLSNLHFEGTAKLVKKTFPIAISTILAVAYGRMDVFFIGKFCSDEELGLYTLSARLVEPFQFLAGALAVNAYGHIALYLKKSAAESLLVNARYRKLMCGYAVLAFIFILVVANFFLTTLFFKYAATQWMLNITGIILLFRCGNLITTSGIQAYGNYKWISLISIWNFFFLAALMTIFVPNMGAYGALVSLLIMEGINFLLQNYYLRKIVGNSTK